MVPKPFGFGFSRGWGGIPSSGSGSAGRHHKWGSRFRFGFNWSPGAGSGVRMRSLSTILEYWRSYDVPRKTCIGCSWSLHAFSFGNLLRQWRPSPRRIIPTSFEHHESRVINQHRIYASKKRVLSMVLSHVQAKKNRSCYDPCQETPPFWACGGSELLFLSPFSLEELKTTIGELSISVMLFVSCRG